MPCKGGWVAAGKIAVYAALAGNGLVKVSKIAAAIAAGSSSLMAEALHSVADTSDSALLLLGQKRSKKPRDDLHPFGHGRELYFWSMVVALMIFMVGGAASVIEGVSRVRHPEPLESAKWSYIVLALSFLFESATGIIAFLQFKKGMKPREGYWEAYRTAKDPATFMVLFEDSAAVAGFRAFVSVWLSHQLGKPWIDGAASIAIGLLLMTIAGFLCSGVRQLLIGERVDKDVLEAFTRTAAETEGVAGVIDVKTIHLGPEDVVAIFTLRFGEELSATDAEATARTLKERLRERHPEVKQMYVALSSGPDATNCE